MFNFFRYLILGPAYFYHKFLIFLSKKSTGFYKMYISFHKSRWNRTLVQSKNDILNAESARKNKLFYLSCLFLKQITTGGTTGEPLVFYIDRFFRRQKERAYIFDIWSTIGYKPFDLRVIIRGNQGEELIKYNWFENAYKVSVNKLKTNADYQELFYFLIKIKPFFFHVYPSTLLALLNFYSLDQIRQLSIKGVFAGSESFPYKQMLSIEKKYNIKIVHWYGHAEYACLAFFCRLCRGFHFYPTYGYVKLVASDDKEIHRILATSYNFLGTKFLNYDTKDLALVNDIVCSDSQFLRIDKIIGRDQEFFVDRYGDKRAIGPFLFGMHNVHKDFWLKLNDIQFIQVTRGELIVNISCADQNKEFVQSMLESRFTCVQLKFRFHDNLVVRTSSNKRQYFIQQLSI